MCNIPFKIDTKGSCLFCQHPDSPSIDSDRNEDSITAFKMLLRYLKVDMMKMAQLTSANGMNPFASGLESANLSVSLCEECSSVTGDFHELFQTFESIRLQLDLCVGQLYEFMEKGGNNPNHQGNSTAVAEWLRSETKEKASLKVNATMPRISLPQLSLVYKSEQLESVDSTMMTMTSEQSSNTPDISAEIEMPSGGQPLECIYCGKILTRKCHLENHQLNHHTFSYLWDHGLLPSNISEQQLETCVADMVRKFKSPSKKCPFCERKGFKIQYDSRIHLLRYHFPMVIREIENAGEDSADKEEGAMSQEYNVWEIKSEVPASEPQKRDKKFKAGSECAYCRQMFSGPPQLKTHQLMKHAAISLADEGLLSPAISEGELNTTLNKILDKMTTFTNCPLCKIEGLRCKSLVRVHLLRCHLSQVTNQSSSNSCNGSLIKLRCVKCKMNFAHRTSFQTHQLNKHPVSYLSEKGLLPGGIAEHLESALENIFGQMKSIKNQCHFCTTPGFQSKCHLKTHLLRRHLQEVIKCARKISNVGRRRSHQKSKIKIIKKNKPYAYLGQTNRWKCTLCGSFFPNGRNFQRHRFQVHSMTVLKGRLSPSISEESAATSFSRICDKMTRISKCKAGKFKLVDCLWCGKTFWDKSKVHLLRCHLDQVVREMEDELGTL